MTADKQRTISRPLLPDSHGQRILYRLVRFLLAPHVAITCSPSSPISIFLPWYEAKGFFVVLISYHTISRKSSILQTFVWYFLSPCISFAFRQGIVRSGNRIYIYLNSYPAPSRTGKYRLKLKFVLFETGRQPKFFWLPPLLLFHFCTILTQYFPRVSCRLSLTARPTPLLLRCRKAEKVKGDF